MDRRCNRCDKNMGPDRVTDTTGCKHYCPECVEELFDFKFIKVWSDIRNGVK